MKSVRGLALDETSFYESQEVKEYADINNELGLINHEKGNFKRAVEFFKKALETNPNYTEAALNLTITLNEIGHYDEARTCLARAASGVLAAPCARDPYILKKIADQHADLGNQYASIQMWEEAVEQYRKALHIAPDFVDVLTKLGVALHTLGNDDEAIYVLTRAIQIRPTYVPALLQLGLIYYLKGFLGPALSQWETASMLDPGKKATQAYMGLFEKRKEIAA